MQLCPPDLVFYDFISFVGCQRWNSHSQYIPRCIVAFCCSTNYDTYCWNRKCYCPLSLTTLYVEPLCSSLVNLGTWWSISNSLLYPLYPPCLELFRWRFPNILQRKEKKLYQKKLSRGWESAIKISFYPEFFSFRLVVQQRKLMARK